MERQTKSSFKHIYDTFVICLNLWTACEDFKEHEIKINKATKYHPPFDESFS